MQFNRVGEGLLQVSSLTIRGRKRTENISLRLDSDLRSILEEESRRNRVNFNTLVSQIFWQYASWGRFATKLRLLPTTKDLLRELFQAVPKETIEEIGTRLGETSGHEQILFLFQRVNSGTVLRFLELWGSHFDAFEHRIEGGRHLFTIHHDINLKFSTFIKTFVASMLKSTGNKTPEFESVSPNAVTFSYEP